MQTDKLSATTEKLAVNATTTPADFRAEMAEAMRDLARPAEPGEGVKAAIRKALKRLGHPDITPGMAKRLWYGEVHSLPGHIVLHIVARRAAHRANLDRDLVSLKRRLEILEGKQSE